MIFFRCHCNFTKPAQNIASLSLLPVPFLASPVPGTRGREEGWGRQGEGSRDQGAGRRAGGGRGRSPGTCRPGGGLGEAGEGVPGPGGREEGWGRQGKGSRDM